MFVMKTGNNFRQPEEFAFVYEGYPLPINMMFELTIFVLVSG